MDDFSSPVTLSNCTTGAEVPSRIEEMTLRRSSSPSGISLRNTPPWMLRMMEASSDLPLPRWGAPMMSIW